MTEATALHAFYWLAVGSVGYTYVVYPALLWLLARFRSRPPRREAGRPLPTVSVVIAAYNEESDVARRVEELTRRIIAEGLTGEVVVVSDGSTDATAEVARGFEGRDVPVTVIALPENQGKAVALSIGCEAASHEVIVFADARQCWADDALTRLVENFADDQVGAVGGELFVESAPGVMAGVGLYWRYEKMLRRWESLVHSTVGVTGAISAVRRGLFRPIPAGTVIDDVYWPLCVVLGGDRVVFESRAHAFDRLPDEVNAELRRKIRTLAGNFQLMALLPEALLPWRNPIWFALVSHKLMRLVVPWAYLVMGLSAWTLGGPIFGGLLALQLSLTLLGLAGLLPGVAARSRLAAAAGSFLVLNTAAWLAFWVFATGQTTRSWTKTHYRTATPTAAALELEGVAR